MTEHEKVKRIKSFRFGFSIPNRVRIVLIVLFGIVFVVSSVMLVRSVSERKQATDYYSDLAQSYSPVLPTVTTTATEAMDTVSPIEDTADETTEAPATEPPKETDHIGENWLDNPSLAQLMEQYPDVVCWITVNGTSISYPVVQAKDNDYYLRKDLNSNYLISGTIFMDYRCSDTFTDWKTMIYGHHMKYGTTMFGDLKKYNTDNFLAENRDVYLSFPDFTYHYTAYAYMVVKSSDPLIYNLPENPTEEEKTAFLAYVKKNARYLNWDMKPSADSMFLVLSTCSYEYDDARMVLICVAG